MDALMTLAWMVGGIALVATGAGVLLRSLRRLRRAGVFEALYWASFRRFAGYRFRALRPAGSALVGLLIVGGGLAMLYVGLTSYYASRLGRISG